MKHAIYKLVEKGSNGSKTNQFFDYAIMGLILLNVIAIILETIPEIFEPLKSFFRIFEITSIVIFSLEYIMRLYISDLSYPSKSRLKSAIKFIFSPYGIIDLLAIIPFYLPFLIKIDLRFLRILRLTRFFRILKINRYNNSLSLIWSVIKEKKTELGITGFITFLILLNSSFLMYYIEGDKQPEAFPDLAASLWWAVATLTTVGYGDIYPVTGLGRFISALLALAGIGIVALPTGIIGGGFMEKIENKNTICPHCNKAINAPVDTQEHTKEYITN